MSNYVVSWSIDIEDVDSPEGAALAALAIQRDQQSSATVFTVQSVDRQWNLPIGHSRILGDPVEVYL